MFILFTTFIKSAVFGIDFGNENIKTGMALQGKGVHVALNQNSKRLSPAYFSFWNKTDPLSTNLTTHLSYDSIDQFEWAFEDFAKTHMDRFPNNGFRGLGQLLSTERGFNRREILSLMMQNLISTIDESKWKPEHSHLIWAIEPSLPLTERYAIIESLNLTSLTLDSIITAPTAASELYALEKRKSFSRKKIRVVFIDIGAVHTWASLFQFESSGVNPIVTELAFAQNITLGGDLLDESLVDLLVSRFISKYPKHTTSEIIQNPKIYYSFLQEARKAKEILSGSPSVYVKFEDILGEDFFSTTISRSDFENTKISQDFKKSIQSLIDTLFSPNFPHATNASINSTINSTLNSTLNLTFDENINNKTFVNQYYNRSIQGVELIGGTTRVPFIQDAIKSALNIKKLNRTMNSDESVALGAAYIGQKKESYL